MLFLTESGGGGGIGLCHIAHLFSLFNCINIDTIFSTSMFNAFCGHDVINCNDAFELILGINGKEYIRIISFYHLFMQVHNIQIYDVIRMRVLFVFLHLTFIFTFNMEYVNI